MALYTGFSTYNRYKKFRLTDFDLVQQDLFNHFNIRKGEKLMNPEFGTIIWGMLFEPLTEGLRKTLTEDIKRIVAYDPRIATNSIRLDEFAYGLQISISVTYLVENKNYNIVFNFDRDSKTLSKGVVGGNTAN
jgi:phage baseplate assembly protein W